LLPTVFCNKVNCQEERGGKVQTRKAICKFYQSIQIDVWAANEATDFCIVGSHKRRIAWITARQMERMNKGEVRFTNSILIKK
jgi:hypothetical protein